MEFSTVFDQTFLGNDVRAWATALVAFLVVLGALLFIRRLLAKRLGAIAARTTTSIDDFAIDLLGHTHTWFLVFLAIAAALQFLTPISAGGPLKLAVKTVFILQLALWGNELIAFGVRRLTGSAAGAGGQSTVTAMAFVARVALWGMILLLLLHNFGLQVTALITGLGVSGIAVALAAQSILGDLFAAMSIYLDKPFLIGDFIIFDDFLGSVQYVGLRSTRIQSLSGEQIIISNSDLLKTRIRNYKRMAERRVVFSISAAYGTPAELVARVPGIIRAAVEAQSNVRFDRSHFAAYGESSLNFETAYYVLSPDYTMYMDIQQAINFAIMREFEKEGIAFAHPMRMVTLRHNGSTVPSLGTADSELRERIER
jgi:small-conductance mechanosensitive channel